MICSSSRSRGGETVEITAIPYNHAFCGMENVHIALCKIWERFRGNCQFPHHGEMWLVESAKSVNFDSATLGRYE